MKEVYVGFTNPYQHIEWREKQWELGGSQPNFLVHQLFNELGPISKSSGIYTKRYKDKLTTRRSCVPISTATFPSQPQEIH